MTYRLSPEERCAILRSKLGLEPEVEIATFCSCGNDCGKIFLPADYNVKTLESAHIPFKWHAEHRTTKVIIHF